MLWVSRVRLARLRVRLRDRIRSWVGLTFSEELSTRRRYGLRLRLRLGDGDGFGDGFRLGFGDGRRDGLALGDVLDGLFIEELTGPVGSCLGAKTGSRCWSGVDVTVRIMSMERHKVSRLEKGAKKAWQHDGPKLAGSWAYLMEPSTESAAKRVVEDLMVEDFDEYVTEAAAV